MAPAFAWWASFFELPNYYRCSSCVWAETPPGSVSKKKVARNFSLIQYKVLKCGRLTSLHRVKPPIGDFILWFFFIILLYKKSFCARTRAGYEKLNLASEFPVQTSDAIFCYKQPLCCTRRLTSQRHNFAKSKPLWRPIRALFCQVTFTVATCGRAVSR